MMANAEHTGKGILHQTEGSQKYSLARYAPSDDLKEIVQRYWVVRWDLRGQPPYRQVILSHPNVNLVFERDNTRIYGVTRTISYHVLTGEGKVLGIKFAPGGFYPFWQAPVFGLTERSVTLREAFGIDGHELEKRVLAYDDDLAMVAETERFLRARLPENDPNIGIVRRIVEAVAGDRELTKVDDLVRKVGMNKRTLQRLFHRYVGVSPKWVIQRSRLHDAAELLERGHVPDWSGLSHELGYYDQAHFIKDFKAIVGSSPEQYVKDILTRMN